MMTCEAIECDCRSLSRLVLSSDHKHSRTDSNINAVTSSCKDTESRMKVHMCRMHTCKLGVKRYVMHCLSWV